MKQDLVFAAMEQSVEASLRKFNDACYDAINASYVIASGKISKLLISIASSKPIFALLQSLLDGYNFINDFDTCKFRDEKGAPYLQPPTDTKQQICFAFCLLFALDTNKLELKNLLSSFYKHQSGANYEYELFCEDIIVPFKQNINYMLAEKTSADLPQEESASTI